ncbi:MAG TPA: VWA domain-containing protein [Thermoanaerobaculia bacterium]|nr:VWA domain-containing protein [Thermoanaerobaculia bacterium]
MKRAFAFALFASAFCLLPSAFCQPVRITLKPEGLVHGTLLVPASVAENVTRIELFVNGVKYSEAHGRSVVMPVRIGDYIRRLRIRVAGYDAQNNVVGEDEMVVNDPQPPFRVHLQNANGTLSAAIVKPPDLQIESVDFFIGEAKVGTANAPPYQVSYDTSKFLHPVYARVAVHASNGDEANDVLFFGTNPSERVDVTLQQIPLSVVGSDRPPQPGELTLLDNGQPRKIEALVPASNEPLNVILLIDYSESMIEEMPVVKAAAKQFAQALLRPNDRIAIVGFNQTLFWLTPWTNDFDLASRAIDRVKPGGETHLYDSAIEMLYELQKRPGRRALVVFTDGVDQGSTFKLDHLIHYARYAGVPLYPVIKNRMLMKLMRWGIGHLEARKIANVAKDTGATYFIIQRESELPSVYARIAQELRNQYQLDFYSDASAPDLWHALQIRSSAGQNLRIPSGYFP